MRILGIDPGVATIGFGVVNAEGTRLRMESYGTITTPAGLPLATRLLQIETDMEQLYLMPGEERYTKFRDENGVPKIRYTYCSLHGKLFNCVCRSTDEAQRLCEDWLVTQDRCYIN